MNVTYGSREGQYFTEWRFTLLKELLDLVHTGQVSGISKVLEVENPQIFYDQTYDFHHLTFQANGKSLNVRLYKVFSVTIDDSMGWTGCPQGHIHSFADYIRKQCGV